MADRDARMRLTPAAALQALAEVPEGPPFRTLFRHGSLEIEIYKPVGEDLQLPHARDEVYVVIAGRGEFVRGGARQPFEPGEVLFVPAGVEHRFENFSDDFSTWVLFHGPQGGEKDE
jgi:mannose-6-phosphate isomerase-like protein (cupin superfamily)